MPANATHFDFDRDSRQSTYFRLFVGSIALVASFFFTTFAKAQDFGPVQPVQHTDAMLVELLAADQAAFVLAKGSYATLVEANAAYEAASAALSEAIETGVTASSPAENLGGLAQELVNARVAKEAAQAEFDLATANLATARTAYEAAVADSIPEETAIAEEDLPETDNLARIDKLEAQLLALKAAVCDGHDYAHDHAAAYTAICSTDDQAANTAIEGEVAPE